MNYLDPLPIVRIKEERKKKLKKNKGQKTILIIKKLIKHPYSTINNYHYYFNKYSNVYGNSLIKSKLGDNKLKFKYDKSVKKSDKGLKLKKLIIKNNENNLIKEVKVDKSNKNIKENIIVNKSSKKDLKIKINNEEKSDKSFIVNNSSKSVSNIDNNDLKIDNSIIKKSKTCSSKNNKSNINDNQIGIKINWVTRNSILDSLKNFDSKKKEKGNLKIENDNFKPKPKLKQRKSLYVNKEEALKEFKKSVNSQLLDQNKESTDFKETFYDLEVLFKKNHQIINIINTSKNIYNKIINEKDYNERLKIFNFKFFENEKLIFLNSMSFFVNGNQIMIPFSITFFLMKYPEDYLVKFFKELIFLLYRRKIKGFKKSILNFHDFYLINKQIIHNTIDNKNSIKESYKIKEIPQNNKQVRKSIFFNNHNNNVVGESQNNLNLLNKFKQYKVESNSSSNSSNSSNSESKSNSSSGSSKSSKSSNSSESSDSSFDEEELNQIKDKKSPIKSENINKMEIIFAGNFNKSKKIYEAIIRYPLATIYLNGYISNIDKKIIRITNKEVNDLFSYEKKNITHLVKRISSNNSV